MPRSTRSATIPPTSPRRSSSWWTIPSAAPPWGHSGARASRTSWNGATRCRSSPAPTRRYRARRRATRSRSGTRWTRSSMDRRADEQTERLDLSKAAETLIDECRMVLPGIQAIFGFQLIAVFNQRFTDLEPLDVRLHFAALALLALAAALVMTPAAYHRRNGARIITSNFIDVSSLLLVSSMVLLGLGLGADCYVITHLALGSTWIAAV